MRDVLAYISFEQLSTSNDILNDSRPFRLHPTSSRHNDCGHRGSLRALLHCGELIIKLMAMGCIDYPAYTKRKQLNSGC